MSSANPVIFIELDAVQRLHDILVEYGCERGLRNANGLESAVARPRMVYGYDPDSSIYRLAALLAHAICMNHPYVDGNKRLSALASLSFLDINGYTVEANEDELFSIFLSLAAGTTSELDLVSWFEFRGRRLF